MSRNYLSLKQEENDEEEDLILSNNLYKPIINNNNTLLYNNTIIKTTNTDNNNYNNNNTTYRSNNNTTNTDNNTAYNTTNNTTYNNNNNNNIESSEQHLLTTKTLNQVFNSRYRRRSFIALLLYFIIGICYYHLQQKLSIINSIYYLVITIFTIGYGDYAPVTQAEKLFTCFFISFGVLILTAFIASFTEAFYESHVRSVNERVRRAAIQMKKAETTEELPSNIVEFLDVSQTFKRRKSLHSTGSVEHENLTSFPSMNSSPYDVQGSTSMDSFAQIVRKSMDNLGLLGVRPSDWELAAEEKMLDTMQKLNLKMFDEELRDMENQSKLHLLIIISVIGFGVLSMLWIENWTFIDSLYWALVTITTVGYGDVVPRTFAGKAVTILFCFVGCILLAWSLNNLIRYPLVIKSKQSELRVMMQFGGKLSEDTLREILTNDFFERNPNLRQSDESITKAEFTLMLLSMMNKINDKDVLIVSKIFDILDENKLKILSAANMIAEIEKAQKREEKLRWEELMKERDSESSLGSRDFFKANSFSGFTKHFTLKKPQKVDKKRDVTSLNSMNSNQYHNSPDDLDNSEHTRQSYTQQAVSVKNMSFSSTTSHSTTASYPIRLFKSTSSVNYGQNQDKIGSTQPSNNNSDNSNSNNSNNNKDTQNLNTDNLKMMSKSDIEENLPQDNKKR